MGKLKTMANVKKSLNFFVFHLFVVCFTFCVFVVLFFVTVVRICFCSVGVSDSMGSQSGEPSVCGWILGSGVEVLAGISGFTIDIGLSISSSVGFGLIEVAETGLESICVFNSGAGSCMGVISIFVVVSVGSVVSCLDCCCVSFSGCLTSG